MDHQGALPVPRGARLLPALSLALSAWLAVMPARAADISPSGFAVLQAQVRKTGLVRVMVTVEHISLKRLTQDRAEVEAELAARTANLLAELGSSVFPTGRWTNGMGQVGFYTDADGLRILSATQSAVSFGPDIADKTRSHAYYMDGSLDLIEEALGAAPSVAVDIVFNTAGPAYTLQRDGSTKYHGPSEVNALLDRVLSAPYAHGIRGIDRRQNPDLTPIVAATIDREAFYGLRDSTDIRALRLQGTSDPRQANWPDDTLEVARKTGRAEISILLRGGASYSTSASMPPEAYRHQMDANVAALKEILADAGFDPLPPLSDDAGAGMGLVFVMATLDQLTRLYANRDPRVLSIDVNKGG